MRAAHGGDVTTIGRAEDARCGPMQISIDEIPNVLHIDAGLPDSELCFVLARAQFDANVFVFLSFERFARALP